MIQYSLGTFMFATVLFSLSASRHEPNWTCVPNFRIFPNLFYKKNLNISSQTDEAKWLWDRSCFSYSIWTMRGNENLVRPLQKQPRVGLIAIPLFELSRYRFDYSSNSPYHHFLSEKVSFSSLSKSTRPRNGWFSCTRGIQSRSVSHIWSQGTGGKSSWLSVGDRENHSGLISSDLGHDCGC